LPQNFYVFSWFSVQHDSSGSASVFT
jgi:hypothetical protein